MNDIVHAELLSAFPGGAPQAPGLWEFLFCLSGGCAPGEARLAFSKGDMAVIPPGASPLWETEESPKIIRLLMERPMLLLKEPCVIPGDGSPHLQAAFEGALHYFQSGLPARRHLLTAYGGLIVCCAAVFQDTRGPSSVVADIEREVRARFADPAYELEETLRALPFNYDYLRKLFQREMGVTPLQYLTDLRLHAAADALLSADGTAHSVAEIARMCGFREPLYFSRTFKKKYGLSPTYYAASMKGKISPDPEDA